MAETNSNTSDFSGEDRAHLVELLMQPTRFLHDMALALSSLNADTREQFQKLNAERESERTRLQTLPISELKALLSKQQQQAAAERATADAAAARRKTEAAAKDARKEAARVYNQPNATADFEHWAKMDHWTFDEALVLLLGKDPRVLTRSVVKEELSRDRGFTVFAEPRRPKSAFLKRYEDLRQLAERAAVMNGPKLRPVDVLVWAHRTGAIAPPADLVRGVAIILERTKAARAKPPAPAENPNAQALPAPSASAPLPIKRAALVKKHERTWPSIESDLKHAIENGLQEAAKAEGRGMWKEVHALEWAEQRGKLTRSSAIAPHTAHSPFGRIRDADA